MAVSKLHSLGIAILFFALSFGFVVSKTFYDGVPASSYHALFSWLKENGVGGLSGPDPLLQVSISDRQPTQPPDSGSESSEYGKTESTLELLASQHISSKDAVLSFPPMLLISPLHAAKDSLPYEGASDDEILATWILVEKSKGDSSFWFPFINSLPKELIHPLFWDESSLQELEYEPTLLRVEQQRKAIDEAYKKCTAGKIPPVSKNDFAWAYMLVKTLKIPISIYDSGSSNASATVVPFLLPIPDFREITVDPQIEWKGQLKKGNLELTAVGDVYSDQPIHMSYPLEENGVLLADYGYFPYDNPYDRVALFRDINSIVSYFIFNASNGIDFRFNYNDAVKNAKAAILYTEKELEAKFESDDSVYNGPEYDFKINSDFSIWPERHTDPRLISVFSFLSMILTGEELSEKEKEMIVSMSINLGYAEEGFSCDAFDTDEHAGAIVAVRSGVEIVRDYLVSVVKKFNTSYMEDYRTLNPKPCSENDPDDKDCQMSPFFPSMSAEIAIRMRMMKKVMMLEAMNHLRSNCGTSEEDDSYSQDEYGGGDDLYEDDMDVGENGSYAGGEDYIEDMTI